MMDTNSTYPLKYFDRFPNTPMAGKRIPKGDRVKECLQEITPRPITPLAVKKFLKTSQPGLGAIRVFYGKANDPDIASTIVHGVSTKPCYSGGTLINPPLKTLFQEKSHQLSEAIYSTNQKSVLGRSHDQSLGLPKWHEFGKTTFGSKAVKSKAAGGIVNPPKTYTQVEMEAEEGHPSYIRSHNAYFVGECVDRKYDRGRSGKNNRFGLPTPHYTDGRRVRDSLSWDCDTQKHNSAKFVSKTCDDFRERMQPQIGKVIGDSLKVPPNHTFGVLMRPDNFGVGDLIHSPKAEEYRSGGDRQRTLISAVRQHLKKINFHNFKSLLHAFRHYDKKRKGYIDKDDLREVCRQFNLELSEPVLDALVDYCDLDQHGYINFLEFANFLNWKDKMPINKSEQRILTGDSKSSAHHTEVPWEHRPDYARTAWSEPLLRPEDLELVEVGSPLMTPKTLSRSRNAPGRFATSSSVISSVAGAVPTANYRTFGTPTVRTDLAAPRIKRVNDRTNYGDAANAYALLYPSLHSLRGVHEKDFFCPRTREEISQIFRNVGIDISEKNFEEAWKRASSMHPTGNVCVNSFRNVLQGVQSN